MIYPRWQYRKTELGLEKRIIASPEQEEPGWEDSPAAFQDAIPAPPVCPSCVELQNRMGAMTAAFDKSWTGLMVQHADLKATHEEFQKQHAELVETSAKEHAAQVEAESQTAVVAEEATPAETPGNDLSAGTANVVEMPSSVVPAAPRRRK